MQNASRTSTKSHSVANPASTSSSDRFLKTITQLSSTFSEPSSEELRSTWFGESCSICSSAVESHSSTKLKGKTIKSGQIKGKGKEKESSSNHECPTKDTISLRAFKKALDSGKYISGGGEGRGIPMRLVVLTLKASWHENGTWPLIGCDELEPPPSTSTSTLISQPLPRSIHPSNLILKPRSTSKDPYQPDPGPPTRPEVEADEIARNYRSRGVDQRLLQKPVLGEEDW